MPVVVNCPSCGSTTEVGPDGPARCAACGAEVAPHRPRDRGPRRLLAGWVALAVCAAVVGWSLLRSDAPRAEEHDWRPHEFDNAGVRVEIPAAPRNVARVTGLRLPTGVLTAGTVLPGRGEEYAVLCTDIDPVRRAAGSDDALVSEAVAALLTDDPPARKTDERPARVAGFAGREVAYDVPDRGSSGVVRVVVAGDRLFRVVASGPGMTPDDDRAKRFLDSFVVTDPDLLARAQGYAAAARPVGLAVLTRLDPHEACAFDPARRAFWMVADRRAGGPPPDPDPLGRNSAARRYYLRRYSYPGFRLEAEYRVGERTTGMAVCGDRLYLTENPIQGGDSRFRTKPKVTAYDLRELPAAGDAPLLTPDARTDVPGGDVRRLAADPVGRWVVAMSGGPYAEGFVTRLAADLSGTPASLSFPGMSLSHDATVSRDGATVTVTTGTQFETTWVDIDAAEWRVRRKETGYDRRYTAAGWARSEERTFAAEWEGRALYELRWDGRRAGAAQSVAEVRPWSLAGSADGRYLFCLCAPTGGEPATLRVFRTDVPLPRGAARPVCGSIPVEGAANIRYRFTVALDAAAVVFGTGLVIAVTHPPAD